jgi:hypothetical protein
MELKTKWKRVCSLCAAHYILSNNLAPLYMWITNATIACMREQHACKACAVSATPVGWLSHLVEQMLWLVAGHCCPGGYRQGVCNMAHSDMIHTLTGVAANGMFLPYMRGANQSCCFTTHACLPCMLLLNTSNRCICGIHWWGRVHMYCKMMGRNTDWAGGSEQLADDDQIYVRF